MLLGCLILSNPSFAAPPTIEILQALVQGNKDQEQIQHHIRFA